jgi:hypothetical protein
MTNTKIIGLTFIRWPQMSGAALGCGREGLSLDAEKPVKHSLNK